MFDQEIIEIAVNNIGTAQEALEYLGRKMIEKGVGKETFVKAIVEREKVFPTGLQFDGYGVAIPHTDAEHVLKNQIAVMTLKEPVIFNQMANEQIHVPVNTIFMLAINQPHAQLEVLQQLMSLLQDKTVMESINNLTNTPQHIQSIIAMLKSNGIY
ncbi:PTS sugar transporter subunit IIA [Granulicatella seriolae]|uniref:PTS sugar transporter subunit IIA n=1 Tax=Granulicatella seriolae TaxID=2967226 RepID=A0ABT1WMN3_9LACT|nr:PTS sugar transporter subunit IIA [Granulicatella seriolae]